MYNKEYYIISKKSLAITIAFLSCENFEEIPDRFNEGKSCYKFKNTEKFKEILTLINKIRKSNFH